jgi:type VI secretion system protein ImpC
MPKPISFGTFDFNLVASMDDARGEVEPGSPFRILVLGDFSGRASRGVFDPHAALAARKLHPVDRDDLEDVMAELGVKLRLPISADDSTDISFSEMDDFHPDRLYEVVEVFRDIHKRITKQQLPASPANRQILDESLPEGSLNRVVNQTSGNLLDQILEKTASDSGESVATSDWDRFLSRVVSPHVVIAESSAELKARESVEIAAGDLMRALLQYPEFKELEAAWRGLKLLVSGLETGEDLQVVLLDVTKEELRHDLCATESLADTGFFRLSVKDCTDGPWGLIVGNYSFDKSVDDLALLGRLARVSGVADAPFVGAAGESFFYGAHTGQRGEGADQQSADEAWEILRQIPEARFMGLATPDILLRLPYGKQTEPLESFDFEEMAPIPDHSAYLWGNPVFVAAQLLGESFAGNGWEMVPGVRQELGGMPIHAFRVEGDAHITPAVKRVYTQEQLESLLDGGFIPLLTFKGRDVVRIARFQSIAASPSLLSGRWKSSR